LLDLIIDLMRLKLLKVLLKKILEMNMLP